MTFSLRAALSALSLISLMVSAALAGDPAQGSRVSEATAPIEGSREACRARECELGNLVTDAILERFRGEGVELVIVNGGSMRGTIDAGEITRAEIAGALPFENRISTFRLKGSDVVAALENGVSELELGSGRFPQIAGLRFVFDPSKPPNQGRIIQVETRGEQGWTPIDPDRAYGVATNDFLRGGGDGYVMFRDKAENADDSGPVLEELVAAYLAAHEPYQPRLDGRISLASGLPGGKAGKAGMAAPAAEVEPAMRVHVLRPGDSLWELARSHYGEGAEWRRILQANPEVHPRRLRVGHELLIPPAAPASGQGPVRLD